METIDEYRMTRKVLIGEVSEALVGGRPRFGWIDIVKVALGSRGMTLQATRQCAKNKK